MRDFLPRTNSDVVYGRMVISSAGPVNFIFENELHAVIESNGAKDLPLLEGFLKRKEKVGHEGAIKARDDE